MEKPATPEKAPKQKKTVRKVRKKPVSSGGSSAEDQRVRGYYYDDSHGYKKYIPEEVEDESATENE